MKQQELSFSSAGLECRGMLYPPERAAAPAPVILMCHGLGTERTFGLLPYAERFTAAGLAVMHFDYRNFGASAGEPRNLIDPARHVADVLAALAHLRSRADVDGARIALWGSSFGGGHVLVAAARDGRVAAVAAQVPFVDGLATLMVFPIAYQFRALWHALRDVFRRATGRAPHTVPVVGRPDEFALMNTPESWPGYTALIPKDSTWKNAAPARIVMTLSLYRPCAYAARIRCPVYLIYAEQDSLIPARAVERTAKKISDVESLRLPAGHFDLYRGPLFEQTSRLQLDFFLRHLTGEKA